MNLNKKGYSAGLFGFFFILMIISVIFFFMTYVMHYVLYDYGINELQNIAGDMLAVDGEAMTNINSLSSTYLGFTGYYDILFLVLIVSAFIESTIAAVRAKESGFFSFFGFITIGNLFLILVMSYGVQVQGWLLNEIIFNILAVNVDAPIMEMFFNYGIYFGVFWYLWLIAVNQINFNGLKERFNEVFNRQQSQTESNDFMLDNGRFEQ